MPVLRAARCSHRETGERRGIARRSFLMRRMAHGAWGRGPAGPLGGTGKVRSAKCGRRSATGKVRRQGNLLGTRLTNYTARIYRVGRSRVGAGG